MVKKQSAPTQIKKCQCIVRSRRGYCTERVRCPHVPVTHEINKEDLARKQYFEMLCSLKGAWSEVQNNAAGETTEEEAAEEEETLKPLKRIVCRGRMTKRPERSYVHYFLSEVWSLLTPEMLARLKEMLQTEFDMTPEEAEQFIREQKAKTILQEPEGKKVKGYVVRRGRKCAGIRHYYNSQFNRIVSAKLADYLVTTLSARRTKNQRKISEFLIKNLCDVTGEKFTLQYPKTLTHKMMVFGTDAVAGWLAERVVEAEELIRDDREVEELKAAKKKREKEKKKEAKEANKQTNKNKKKQENNKT